MTRRTALTLIAILLLAINLRPVLASVPPLSLDIQADLGWGDALMGAVTTIPVLGMAVFALIVPPLAVRIGRAWTAAVGMIVIAVGTGVRLVSEAAPWVLLASSVLVGMGIAIGAGIMPSFVREWFPTRIGAMTSVTTATFMFGATLAAALAVPAAAALGGWPVSLSIWALPAVAAAIIWVAIALRSSSTVAPAATRRPPLPWRSGTAWLLSAFLAFNSLLFYSILAWLAPSYDDRGWTQAEGGYLLAVATVAQIVAALVLPAVAHRMRDRRPLFVGAVLVSSLGMLMIAFVPETLTWVVVVLVSGAIGGVFTMGLVLLPELGGAPLPTARLTAMAFALSYGLAAFGPVVMGAIVESTGTWATMYVVLMVIGLLQLVGVAPMRPGARVVMPT